MRIKIKLDKVWIATLFSMTHTNEERLSILIEKICQELYATTDLTDVVAMEYVALDYDADDFIQNKVTVIIEMLFENDFDISKN